MKRKDTEVGKILQDNMGKIKDGEAEQHNSTQWGLILAIAVLISFCHSCITTNKAIQKVLTTKSAFDTVGQVYTLLHPCINIVERISHDTAYTHDTTTVSKVDTVGKYIYDTTVRKIRTTATIHDTATIVDGQQISILNSQIEESGKQIAMLNQAVTDKELAINIANSNIYAWRWKAICTWIVLFIAILGIVFASIYKPRL